MFRFRNPLIAAGIAAALSILVCHALAQPPGRGGPGGPRRPGGPGGPGGSILDLVQNAAVQVELKVKDAQKTKIQTLAETVNQHRRQLRGQMDPRGQQGPGPGPGGNGPQNRNNGNGDAQVGVGGNGGGQNGGGPGGFGPGGPGGFGPGGYGGFGAGGYGGFGLGGYGGFDDSVAGGEDLDVPALDCDDTVFRTDLSCTGLVDLDGQVCPLGKPGGEDHNLEVTVGTAGNVSHCG